MGRFKRVQGLAAAVLLLAAAPAWGQEDDLLDSFGDGVKLESPQAAPAKEPPAEETGDERPFFELDGSLAFGLSYNYQRPAPTPGAPPPYDVDWRGVSRAKPVLRLDTKYNFSPQWKAQLSAVGFYDFAYGLDKRDTLPGKTLRRHRSEGELREAWVQGKVAPWLDVKLGRQIVSWGKSDLIRVVDVLNPVDNREPGMVDVVDLKLPITMTRLDWYFDDWSLQTIAVHEIAFTRNPAYGNEFYPTALPDMEDVIPDHGGKNTEYGARLAKAFSGWDLAFYWADYLDDQGHMEYAQLVPFPILQLEHSRLQMSGLAANVSWGNWVLKGEAAQVSGLRWASLPLGDSRSRLDVSLGVEYYGFDDGSLVVESAASHINQYGPLVAAAPEQPLETTVSWVAAFQQQYLRQTLKLNVVVMAFGDHGQYGALYRTSLAYELAEAATLTGGVLAFQPGEGEGLINQAALNDRLFLEAKYSF